MAFARSAPESVSSLKVAQTLFRLVEEKRHFGARPILMHTLSLHDPYTMGSYGESRYPNVL